MNSPCVNCGADLRVCKECDWYNGGWISKDQYKAKLKADVVDVLDNIRAEVKALNQDYYYQGGFDKCKDYVLDIIDDYRNRK